MLLKKEKNMYKENDLYKTMKGKKLCEDRGKRSRRNTEVILILRHFPSNIKTLSRTQVSSRRV